MASKVFKLDDSLTAMLNAQGFYSNLDIKLYTQFSRFGYYDLYDKFKGGKEYLFFTKPDMNFFSDTSGNNLVTGIGTNTIIYDIYKKNPAVLYQLQKSVNYGGPFMNILTNRVKNTADIPTITAKVTETTQNQFGTKMHYRKHSFESDENIDINIEFEDTKRLEVYSLFKAMDIYANLLSIGRTQAKAKYIKDNELDYPFSIYKFIVGQDGKTIIFYAKYTGVFPTSVPREAFAEVNSTDGLVYSVPFKCEWIEDYDPLILVEFNYLSGSSIGNGATEIAAYDTDEMHINGEWVTTPFVKFYDDKYTLAWR